MRSVKHFEMVSFLTLMKRCCCFAPSSRSVLDVVPVPSLTEGEEIHVVTMIVSETQVMMMCKVIFIVLFYLLPVNNTKYCMNPLKGHTSHRRVI